jgi:hypothetical protein
VSGIHRNRNNLKIFLNIEIESVIIQSDCMKVVQTMKGGFTVNSAAALYDECNIIWSGCRIS